MSHINALVGSVARASLWMSALSLAGVFFTSAPAMAADGGTPLPATASSVRGKRPACVDAQALTVLTFVGHDHVVSLQNRCKKRVTCEVSTDVAPDKLSATLASGENTELVTFRGSPAREFRATADCREN